MSQQVVVMLGTYKGIFVLRSDHGRERWDVDGPYVKGQPAEYVIADTRRTLTMAASVTSPFYGPQVHLSYDGGRTWKPTDNAPRFEESRGKSVERVWVLEPAGRDQPGRWYAGVDPATLFVSNDDAQNWEEVRSLSDHPTRPDWQPGKGGMCLHTVVRHPLDSNKLFVAISAAGVFYTEDGGATWQVRSKGVRADFMPIKMPDVGQCVHKIAIHPKEPDTIYLQNHGGVYRSDDGGATWQTIEEGLPAVFGFPILVHPHDPDTVYIVPLVADAERYTPEGRPTVYRSKDRGRTWKPLRRGLPREGAWLNVLRQAMATDGLEDAGIYFGTTTGQLYGSRNSGDTWKLVAGNLPPILSVRTVVLD